jgi:hypothetical protein
MNLHIYDDTGMKVLRTAERTPVCGKDFCDTCGDCLSCHWDDPCTGNINGEHFWVRYGEKKDNNRR